MTFFQRIANWLFGYEYIKIIMSPHIHSKDKVVRVFERNGKYYTYVYPGSKIGFIRILKGGETEKLSYVYGWKPISDGSWKIYQEPLKIIEEQYNI